MKILFLLPFVRNNIPFVCLCKPQTFETALDATLLTSADAIELPRLLQSSGKIVEPLNFDVSDRNYVLAEEMLELVLSPLHACNAELGDVEAAIAAYKADGWDFYVRASQECDMQAWESRFVEAVPGVAGINSEVYGKLGELLFDRFLSAVSGDSGKKKKKKGKKD